MSLSVLRQDVILSRQVEAVIVICINHILEAVNPIAAVQIKVQLQRRVHMTLMMMAIWMAIMTMTELYFTIVGCNHYFGSDLWKKE